MALSLFMWASFCYTKCSAVSLLLISLFAENYRLRVLGYRVYYRKVCDILMQ